MTDSLHGSLAASDPRRSAWVSANAGAGKTYTLANRVTRLLLDGAAPERILCLTYTKAAAAEMQGRLFQQLGEWSMLPDGKLAENIARIGAEAHDPEQLKQARRLFAQALETPGGLKIQTIHAFCQYLLARFPLEAGVPPAFRVLDDQTARELMAQARARVLERAGQGDRKLADAAAHLVTQTSENRLQTTLDAALGGDRRKLERFLASLSDHDDALAAAVRQAHGAGAKETPESIAADFRDGLDDGECRSLIAWLLGGSKTDVQRGELLGRALEERDFSLFREAFLTGKGERLKALATKNLVKANPALGEALDALAQRFLDADERHRAAHAASLAEAVLALAAAARAEYAALKRSRAALDYDDLIVSTLALLDKGEASAWVLYKLDGGLDHVLIDEAQDTSPEQWAIVRRLTAEFYTGEGAQERVRTVFAVGDEKQSIFSFQGADPLEFDRNKRHFADAATEGTRHFVDVRLDVSRRSAPEVLTFVDQVFAPDAAREGVTSDGSAIAHAAHRKEAKGRVEFWPSIPAPKAPAPDVWRPVDVESRTSPVAQLATRIAAQIKSWTDGRNTLPGHDVPVRPGDIMILMPRREPFASEIIRRLKECGVPVAGADRIRLNDQIAVMDLAALGRFALLPEDDLNLAALLRSPLIGVTEEELYELAHARSGALWSALERRKDETPFVLAHGFLAECRRRADFAPPYEFYAQALSADGLRKRLLARLGPEADDAIDEFLSLALGYEALNAPSLEGFLHWLSRGDAEIKRDMERGRDEVRVMTVHGAKGLEADIVILPDTTGLPEGPGRHGELLYTGNGPVFPVAGEIAPRAVREAKDAAKDEILREHRRLLYVALTRARDRLYVCGFENKLGVREGSWYELAEAAAKALGIGLVQGVEAAEPAPRPDAVTVVTPARPALPGWARDAPGIEHERPRLIRPSQAAGLDEPAALSPTRGAKRFARGNLIHKMLALLPEVEPGKRRAVALAYLKARGAENADALVAETLAVLDDAVFAAAFAPGSRAETAIVADLPQIAEGARINGRIDRLAVTESEVLAIDFKTNRPPPERAEDVSTVYLAQMALYRAALSRIFPGKRIAAALVWTEGPSLMPLPNTLLDAEIGRIRARLEGRLDSRPGHS